ncbi:uncharacterized protein LOC124657657 [Lolium rigidum]|uniref:uncharacterized protein LOC124657657 n=1 Tax=Lolium rigidum TaxID=89674 RepID=UPI001F5C71C5|nr:uncharacterized protein LOC124657657 [Lolium rigidum]
MAEMVGSAVVQEVVSGAFSFMRNTHEEMVSQSHLIERLKWAHLELEFALERTQRMPMIEVSLLKMRMMIKQAFEESRDLLYKQQTLPVNLEEGGTEQGVTLAPSLPNRIMHAVKPFFGTEKGSISGSCVRRFEMFAQKTDKFVRDVESGCSLAPYRFSYPIIAQLLEGKYLRHEMVSGSQTRRISIFACCLEDYGVVGIVNLDFQDLKTPTKCFRLSLMLRLSESTDIVGISTKCLQSLGPQFKSLADVASGELTGISTQVSMITPGPAFREFVFNMINNAIRSFRQEPLCCIGDGFQASAKNMLSSQLTEGFPEQVSYLRFDCFISAAEYSSQTSTVERNRNTIKAWPVPQLSVTFRPHDLSPTVDGKGCTYVLTAGGEYRGPLNFLLELSEVAEFVPLLAVNFFNLEPERTEFVMIWCSAHGNATFTVSKPITEVKRAPKVGDGSKTRRVSKRKR